jgi:hypothetical protein
LKKTILFLSSTIVAFAAGAQTALANLEQQLLCKGGYSASIVNELSSAKLTKASNGVIVFNKGTKLFGFGAETVSLVWEPDEGAKVTVATVAGKEAAVATAMSKLGANLKAKKPPFVVLLGEGSSRTTIVCAWEKELVVP